MALCWVSAEHAGNAMVVVEGLAKQAGTSPSTERCMGCCVWELRSFAAREGVLPPPSWERGAEAFICKPREALHTLDKHLLLLFKGYEVCWVRRDITSILQFGSSSFPEIHSSHYLTWDPVDTHVLAELWHVMWLIMTLLWMYTTSLCIHVRCTLKNYLYVGISGSMRWGWGYVCMGI